MSKLRAVDTGSRKKACLGGTWRYLSAVPSSFSALFQQAFVSLHFFLKKKTWGIDNKHSMEQLIQKILILKLSNSITPAYHMNPMKMLLKVCA